jgi:hypothetical protein
MDYPKYFVVKTTLIPFFVYDGHKEVKFGKNKQTAFVLKNRMEYLLKIIKNIFGYQFDIKKYEFDTEKLLINLELKTNQNKYYIKDFFSDSQGNSHGQLKYAARNYIYHEYFDVAADTWMSGDIELISEGEVDERMYEFYFKFKTLNLEFPGETVIKKSVEKRTSGKKLSNKERPSPSMSATLFEPGTVKKGNDGKMYRVVLNKNGIPRWQKV